MEANYRGEQIISSDVKEEECCASMVEKAKGAMCKTRKDKKLTC